MPVSSILNKIFLLYIYILLPVIVNAQTFPMRVYSIDDGLITNVVGDAIQDKNGMIWCATEVGVSVYNGASWQNFSEKDGLPKCNYLQIQNDNRNYIWVLPYSSRNVICYYDGKRWNKIPQLILQNKKSRMNCFSIYSLQNKYIPVVGTTEGVFTIRDGSWQKIADTKGQLNCDIYAIRNFRDKFYIACKNGLFISDLKNSLEDLNPRFNFNRNDVYAIDISKNPETRPGQDTVCWIFTKKTIGYLNTSTKKFTLVKNNIGSRFIPRNNFYFIKYDGIDRVYCGTEMDKSLIDLRTGQSIKLGMNNGFSTTGNSNVLIDKEGNAWFLSARGIDKISNLFFMNYNRSTGFKEDEVATIKEIKPGKYFTGHNYGFTIFTNYSSHYYGIDEMVSQYSSNCRVIDAVKDKRGNIWFAAGFSGIGKFTLEGNLSWFKYGKLIQFSAVAVDNNGRLLCGSDKGLFILRGDSLRKFSNHTPPPYMARKILITKSGEIYVAAISGLYVFDKSGKLKNLYNDKKKESGFYGLCEFQNNILVGNSEGLFILRNDKLEAYSLGTELINRKIFFIEQDKKNNLWIGTDDGVVKWDGRKLKRYSKENGLMGRETNRSGFCADSFGKIWVGTERGLSCYLPEYDIYDSPPEIINIHLTDITRNQYHLNKEVDLAYNQNTFHLHYNAISYRNESQIKYRIKLAGFEKDSVEFINRNSVRYTNLPPGKYFFLIQAKNYNGEWSKVYKTAMFYIHLPFYLSWWFIVLMIILVCLMGYWVYRYFYNKRYSSLLEQEVKSRTAQLLDSEQKVKSIIKNAPYLILLLDKEKKITYCNRSLAPFFVENSVGKIFINYFFEDEQETIARKLDDLFEKRNSVFMEYNFASLTGKDCWIEFYINPIVFNNQVDEAIAVLIDRTELKQAEYEKAAVERERKTAFEMLERSLNEKEVLLKEIYHRVKNNLQVISSLMYLQSVFVKDKELLNMLQESQNRIRSMSLVHEILYQSKELDIIKLSDYVSRLVGYLSEAYQVSNRVIISLELDSTIIEVDKAIPCGLILNELLSNSLTHGFGNNLEVIEKLEVFISVKKVDNSINLIVKDSGPGLPADYNPDEASKTLGMKLVNLLVVQLGGTLTYKYDKGALFSISFPLSDE